MTQTSHTPIPLNSRKIQHKLLLKYIRDMEFGVFYSYMQASWKQSPP